MLLLRFLDVFYDASYLELAMRLGLPLASKDEQICQAAKRLGVIII